MFLRRTVLLLILFFQIVDAQPQRPAEAALSEKVDSAAIARIIEEGTHRSQVMDLLSWLTDVCGERLTGSPGYHKAAEWTRTTLVGYGLTNAHLEYWGPWGRGWSLKRYSAQVTDPLPFQIISYPKAWSPGTGGMIRGDVVYLDAKTDSALKAYRGTLKGKFIMLSEPRQVKAHFEPEASRLADSTLLNMANADAERPRGRRRGEPRGDFRNRMMLENSKLQLAIEEGAAALLTVSQGDGGTVFVQSASVPSRPEMPRDQRARVYDAKAPKTLPQAVLAAEHYNRIMRMLAKGIKVKMEMNIEVNETRVDSVANVIADLPGTDLKEEVVMIGGHLDSWHAGTGATDDATGVAVCLEAVRILKTLDVKPRRTIRVGFWAAEEQGLLGSRAYVTRHFGERTMRGDSAAPAIVLKPEAEKFSAYFNNDNGTGKVRGIYLQGNESLRPMFRSWLAPFRSMGASTITALNTGGTDHLSFTEVGLPGFQFIQDDIEYDTRTHHSNMDVYERVQEGDLQQAAVLMAAFAYTAAMRDQKIPRRENH